MLFEMVGLIGVEQGEKNGADLHRTGGDGPGGRGEMEIVEDARMKLEMHRLRYRRELITNLFARNDLC